MTHEEAIEDRDRWKRYYFRLDGAVSRHEQSPLFKTEADDALYAARNKVLASMIGAR